MARIIDGKEFNLIGKNVLKLRKQSNMSQQKLSEKLETIAVYISRGSISRLENCERTVTDIEIVGLAKVFKVSINELFKDVLN